MVLTRQRHRFHLHQRVEMNLEQLHRSGLARGVRRPLRGTVEACYPEIVIVRFDCPVGITGDVQALWSLWFGYVRPLHHCAHREAV